MVFHNAKSAELLQICCNKLYTCNIMTLDDLFKKHNLRLTKPRQQVFDALQKSDVPLTISDIAKKCKDINRTSVYRALVAFNDLKIINVVHVGWKNYYELAEPFIPHHHHLYCIRCQNATPIQTPELEQLINYLSRKYSFLVIDHHFELEGVCQKCRQKQQLAKSASASKNKPKPESKSTK